MTVSNLRSALLLTLMFLICISVNAQQKHKHMVKKTAAGNTENSVLKNGIKLKATGFKISEAYLVFDDENLVPEGNKADLNQNVNLVLIIDSGWTETGGRVFPGSRQVITLANGSETINFEDMFAAFDDTGVSPEEAEYINLNAVVTNQKYRNKYANVSFTVWDKKGNAQITGSYKLFIR